MLAACSALLQGCIAFPPLIQVEHKNAPAPPPPQPPPQPQVDNQEVLKRLDEIDRRLKNIEDKETKKP